MMKIEDDFRLYRYGLSVRLVNEDDAKFILKLRTNQKLSKYLNTTDNDVLKQKQWIKEYKARQSKGVEYYFIFYEENNPVGLSRIYDVRKKSFIVGSWLFKETKNVNSPIFGNIITREVAFKLFPQSDLLYDVRKENKKVLNYHNYFSPEKIKEDVENYYFKVSKDNFNKGKDKLLLLLGANSSEKLIV